MPCLREWKFTPSFYLWTLKWKWCNKHNSVSVCWPLKIRDWLKRANPPSNAFPCTGALCWSADLCLFMPDIVFTSLHGFYVQVPSHSSLLCMFRNTTSHLRISLLAARSPPGLAKTPLSALGLQPHQHAGSGQFEHIKQNLLIFIHSSFWSFKGAM